MKRQIKNLRTANAGFIQVKRHVNLSLCTSIIVQRRLIVLYSKICPNAKPERKARTQSPKPMTLILIQTENGNKLY
jgi:hypothetical protein